MFKISKCVETTNIFGNKIQLNVQKSINWNYFQIIFGRNLVQKKTMVKIFDSNNVQLLIYNYLSLDNSNIRMKSYFFNFISWLKSK